MVIAAVEAVVGSTGPGGRSRPQTPTAGEPDDRQAVLASLPPREIAFCRGCPHRASFWAIRSALALDGRDGIVLGDIGCYGLAGGLTGFHQIQTLHCMGAGMGTASGMGLLGRFGFERPVVAVAGDSTFFHACIPAVINARMQGADAVLVVLDNSTTAMTGFQPHPGTPCAPAGASGLGEPCAPLLVEEVLRALGVETVVVDPVADVQAAVATVYDGLQTKGLRGIVLRHACAEWERKDRGGTALLYTVDAESCRGAECGCDRFCTRVLGCPGNRWDADAGSARIDPVFCNGCGLCASLCPAGAIVPDLGVGAAPAGAIVPDTREAGR